MPSLVAPTCAEEGLAREGSGCGSTRGALLGRGLVSGMGFSGRPRLEGTALPTPRLEAGPRALRGLEGTAVLQPVREDAGRPTALLVELLVGRLSTEGVRSCCVCRLLGSMLMRFALGGLKGRGAW